MLDLSELQTLDMLTVLRHFPPPNSICDLAPPPSYSTDRPRDGNESFRIDVHKRFIGFTYHTDEFGQALQHSCWS